MVQFQATPHALVRLKRHSTKVSSLTSLLHLAFGHPDGGCVQEVCETARAKNGRKVRVTLVRGLIGTRESHRATVRGLGLRRINHTVDLEDTPSVRGMLRKVNHLVRVEPAK